jgi:hypothetical protein
MTDHAFDPHEPAPDAIATALTGRSLVAANHRTRGWCLRCQRKNDVRTGLGYEDDTRDPTFEDGERIRLDAGAMHDDYSTAPCRERQWSVTRVYHHDHPQHPCDAVARSDTVVICATVSNAEARCGV